MKILVLMFLFVLMFLRIKDTPSLICEKRWRKRVMTLIEKKKATDDPSTLNMSRHITLFLTFIFELFFVTFYIILGKTIGTSYFIILSALQVFTCFWYLGTSFVEIDTLYSENINDYKFHRFQNLFNVVLDYIYYPLAIYLLLQ